MKRFLTGTLALLISSFFALSTHAQAPAQTVSFSLVAATSLDNSLPFGVYNGAHWQSEAGSQYVKLHMHADEPFVIDQVKINPCSGSFSNAGILYINFDEQIETLKEGPFYSVTLAAPVTVRSLTVNFRTNDPVCVASVELFKAGQRLNVTTPKIVSGTATASSTLDPEPSYHVYSLFDSRFEYAWSTKGKSVGEFLSFAFDEPQHIEKLRIWNGYQRSDTHCFSNSRVKTFTVEGDNGYTSTVNVADIMGSQIVTLDKPYTGKNLKLTVAQAYPGKKYTDLVISELRFSDGKDWFVLNPLNKLKQIASDNKAAFAKSGLSDILNKNLTGSHAASKTKAGQKYGEWSMRLRSDGSLYMQGYTESQTTGGDFYALGNYEVKPSTATVLNLRIFGFLRKLEYEGGMDCNGCGRDCNKAVNENGQEEKIFQENITLTKGSDGGFLVTNISPVKKLMFDKLEMKLGDYDANEK